MKAYKGTNLDMTCNGYQYELGKTFVHDGNVVLFSSGFHFCVNPYICFTYYPLTISRLFEVECEDVSDINSDGAWVCGKITFIREISIDDVNSLATDEQKLEAVRVNGFAIDLISNATDEMKMEAIKSNAFAIRFIDNPTDEMKLTALKKNILTIYSIQNPTDEMKQMALDQWPQFITFIDNPTEEMVLDAVRRNPNLLKFIQNPTPAVIALAKSLS